MLREHDTAFRKLLIISDLVMIGIAFFLSYHIRNFLSLAYGHSVLKGIYPMQTYLGLLPILLTLWAAALFVSGAYQPLRGRSLGHVFIDLLKASLMAAFMFASFAYLTKIHYVSRIFIMTVFSLSWVLLFLERFVITQTLQFVRKKGYNTRYLLVVGTGKRAQKFLENVHQHPEWGFKIQGLIDFEPEMLNKKIMTHKVIGLVPDVPKILEKIIVDEIIFIVPRTWLGKIEQTLLYCEQVGKRVSIAIDLFTMQFSRAQQTVVGDFPLLMFQTTTDKLIQLLLKRFLDIVISSILIFLISPVLITTALMIKLNSKGPIIFRQTRCSLNGRTFTLYKFRTMVMNAETLLESLRKYNEMSGPVFKMANDPRVIKFGKFMRKFSIDELPQLINVLKGDMSIVGPRPPIPAEVKKYEPWQRRRLSMRPGLTCLWQVQGRNKIVKFDEWMKLDLEYIDTWSLWLDLRLFFQTIPIVIFGIGAK